MDRRLEPRLLSAPELCALLPFWTIAVQIFSGLEGIFRDEQAPDRAPPAKIISRTQLRPWCCVSVMDFP
jgi:hypothetical protein